MGLLGDMAKAAAKVAINQVSNTAHEKVSEMFPTKEIVLSGSHERDVYTYYGSGRHSMLRSLGSLSPL